MADQERQRSPEQGEQLKKEFTKAIFEEVGQAFEGSELGTPGEEALAYYEKVVAALPEGKAKEMMTKLRSSMEFSAQVTDSLSKAKDKVWSLVKKVVAAEFPPVLLLPDDINSKIEAGTQRLTGNIGTKLVEWGVKVIEQMKSSPENTPAPAMA